MALPTLTRPAPTRGDEPVVTWVRVRRPVLPAVVVVLSGAAIACYVSVALARIGSPVGLEWMEGGISLHVQRVLSGHSVYGPPSVAFTPYLYTPLFYYVGAAFRAVLGAGLWPLRLVSLLSSLALFGAAAKLAWVETRSRWAAVAGAGLVAAFFAASGSWLDIARVDTLCLALVCWSLVTVRVSRRPLGAAAGAVIAVAAVMTKQIALLPALAVLPYLWRTNRRSLWAYGATFGVGLAVTTAVLQLTSRGWFLFYAVRVPLHHELVPGEITRFWTADMGTRLWPVAVALALGAGLRRGSSRPSRPIRVRPAAARTVDWWFIGPVAGALVLGAYASRLHSGGWDNVLLPAYIAAAIVAAVLLPRLQSTVELHPAVPGLRMAAALPVATLFAVLAYNPLTRVPAPSASTTTAALVQQLRGLSGPVYLPGDPALLAAAGLPTTAQTAAVEDVLRADVGSTAHDLRAELDGLVRQRYFRALVVESERDLTVLPPDVCRYYAPVGTVPGWRNLLPVTGTSTAPKTLWMARPAPLPSTPPHCSSGPRSLPAASG